MLVSPRCNWDQMIGTNRVEETDPDESCREALQSRGSSREPPGGVEGGPGGSAVGSNQPAVANRLPLDRARAGRGPDRGLPLTAPYNVIRYKHEPADYPWRDFAGGVSRADGDFAECDGARHRGGAAGDQRDRSRQAVRDSADVDSVWGFFGQSDDFWHGLQVECDFRVLRQQSKQLTQDVQTAEALMANHG